MTSEPPSGPRDRRSTGWNLLLLAAFLVGTALRVWQIDIQILIDDEWHAIHKLLGSGPVDILTHLGYADYSIPLTLYYQWLYRTIGLSEWGMHVPSLAAGIALLVVGPRLLASWTPLSTRAAWLALVAVSPLLVYHSKVARPYALTSLLTFVAIIAFRSWWRSGRRRDALAYVTVTFLAGWLHSITLPFTLLPFLHYGVQALFGRDRSAADDASQLRAESPRRIDVRPLRRLLALGLATAAPLALALLPPIVVDWQQIAAKAGRNSVTAESLWRTMLMLAGTGTPIVGALLWALAFLGFARVRSRDADLAWYVATVTGVGTAVVASTGAEWIFHPLVLARYLIPVLPFVLWLIAEGVTGIVEHLRRPPIEAGAATLVAAVALAAGPIPGEWHYPNQFWGHLRYQFDYDPAHNPYVERVPTTPVPAFYRELAKLPPGSVTLIEAPWRLESHYNAQSRYQDVHRQLIRIGLVTPVCGVRDFGEYPEERTGMKMRELVHLTSVLRGDAHGADYLVLHMTQGPAATDLGASWPDVTHCLPAIEARLGDPVYRDRAIVVFRLSRLSPLGNNHRPVQQ